MKLHVVAGARPNFMKIAPLWQGLATHAEINPSFVHTAQHRDDAMSSMIWRELGLPDPDHVLDWKASEHGDPIPKMIGAYKALCNAERPDMVLVVGDVNSSLAAALVARDMGIPLVHLEAGLRCFETDMPEEQNRIAIDAMSDLLLTPSDDADQNLLAEGIAPDHIKQVGNIMIDTLVMMQSAVSSQQAAIKYGLNKGNYVLVTLHRQDNVDDKVTLGRIVDAIIELATHHTVCFPIHPRTAKRLTLQGYLDALRKGGIRMLPALGYLDFASLMKDAGLVITDSGGVQEETSFLGTNCLTLRPSTERPVTVDLGTNRLVNASDLVAVALAQFPRHVRSVSIPGWDGNTTERTISALKHFVANL
ncbi:non-hydrolyzing UDP-N-acetylglucosamine 2-epimerase [Thalassospira australica]|uniref:non-hydrolyzing UDP-N-acetylglucosamine 2-epimerase n=1 Tax=Thalassospira australica TaxID=1528106 RepID=UPI00051A89CF|nr:UDP-N-acetylglucosamine 2-epimerase (non-hydrolyzing) [Thalassospira australica]